MIDRIVSGGQTGADRAALDFALGHGLPHGGWCPRGRRAEDGPLGAGYRLQETPADDPAQRTEWNVRDSDGTAIFSLDPRLSGGAALTAECARRLGRPLLHLTPAAAEPARRLREFVASHRIAVLNIAGPRASQEPAVGRFVTEVLEAAFPPDGADQPGADAGSGRNAAATRPPTLNPGPGTPNP